MPAAAVKFQGSVTGTVETIDDSKKRFKLKITKATPGAKSGAADAQTLVTRVVEVSAGGQRDALGKYVHTAEHITWITELKPGASVTLDVRYSGYRNRLKLTTLPKPPKPGVQPPP